VTILAPAGVDRARIASRVGDQISLIHEALSRAPDLEPGPTVNALFGDLLTACQYRGGEDPAAVLSDPRIAAQLPRLRELCAAGEYLLERAWARRIIDAPDPDSQLAAFPYLGNYEQLTRLELNTLAGVGVDLGQVRRICFLGGGPLPLSALLMSRELSVPVDVVDISAEAAVLAADVTRRLSLPALVHVHHADAAQFDAVADSDVVVLAALVGSEPAGKRRVLDALRERMRSGSTLLVRSAHGLRTVLYPPLDLADLQEWIPLGVVHPFNAVVNSVVVVTCP
jgi:nicotianamine synthase